jgi:hypothetical protein
MLEVIEKLLILQDRDRKILQMREELARISPECLELQARSATAQAKLENARLRVKHLESDRKTLELEVETKKQLIDKYSVQQYQTRKNEEYRALTHEIDTCKEAIVKLEDQQLDLMDQGEQAQREVAALTQTGTQVKRTVDGRLSDLAAREAHLRQELNTLEANRNELAAAVEEGTLTRYERLLKQRGGSVVVGIERGVCGGCHMQFGRHLVVACIADQEIVSCPNCGRILYYTRDMDVSVVE